MAAGYSAHGGTARSAKRAPATPLLLIDPTFGLLAVICLGLLLGSVTLVVSGAGVLTVFAVTVAVTAAVSLALAWSSTGGGFWLRVP